MDTLCPKNNTTPTTNLEKDLNAPAPKVENAPKDITTVRKEKRKMYLKNYYLINKEKIRLQEKGYRKKNRTKIQTYRKKNRERYKGHELKYRFGITLEDFNKKLKEQNECCAICGKHQSCFKMSLHVDHDHKTGIIRSLLCHHCNTGLGAFKDDTKLLSKAIDYLKLHKDIQN